MKDTLINNTLLWRQEFASQLLDEIESDMCIDRAWINHYCQRHIDLANKCLDSRQLTFGYMALKIKKKLKRGCIDSVMNYLEMLEDCLEYPYPLSLN